MVVDNDLYFLFGDTIQHGGVLLLDSTKVKKQGKIDTTKVMSY